MTQFVGHLDPDQINNERVKIIIFILFSENFIVIPLFHFAEICNSDGFFGLFFVFFFNSAHDV